MYKNDVDKNAGHIPVNQWMYEEECGRTGTEKGGLLFDEMNIQFGVQLEPQGEGLKLFGYVDFGCYNNGQQNTTWGKGMLVDYVQSNLLSFFGTMMLWNHDFRITYICMDDASINHSSIKEISDTVTNQTTQALATGSFRYFYDPVVWALDSGNGDPGSIPTWSITILLLHLPIYAH